MVEEYGWRFIDELVWIKPGLQGGWKNRLEMSLNQFWFAKDGVDFIGEGDRRR